MDIATHERLDQAIDLVLDWASSGYDHASDWWIKSYPDEVKDIKKLIGDNKKEWTELFLSHVENSEGWDLVGVKTLRRTFGDPDVKIEM